MIKKLIIVSSFLSLVSCSQINQSLGLKDDNIAEEISEAVLYNKTGINVDFTPSSPEQ
jgi:hypothetical protein